MGLLCSKRFFSPGIPVFPSPQKPTIQVINQSGKFLQLVGDSKMDIGLSVSRTDVRSTLV